MREVQMDKAKLLEKVRALGYPLLEKEEPFDANAVLAEVVTSQDQRLWEGFPVMLAHSLEKNLFNYEKVAQHLKTNKLTTLFQKLLMMSLALYEYLGLEFSFADGLLDSHHFEGHLFRDYLTRFKTKKELIDINGGMWTTRVANTFKNYYQRAEFDLKEVIDMQDEFEFEYAMSQIFSKKQKELFLKKLKGERLTKTEKEYYSRAVKKKVLALSNVDLHKLATRLIKE
jgi:hypothetical protein